MHVADSGKVLRVAYGLIAATAWAASTVAAANSARRLTEVVALLAFSRGGQVGQVAITAAVSSLYPALALGADIVMFRERLSGQQLVGVGCIATGLLMLGLT
jgi:drug/metabolite transporter (DMT)-like permease